MTLEIIFSLLQFGEKHTFATYKLKSQNGRKGS